MNEEAPGPLRAVAPKTNRIWPRVHIISLFTTFCSSFPCFFIFYKTKYLPQHHVLEHPQSMFLSQCETKFSTHIKVKLSHNHSWRLWGSWNVGLPSLLWHLAQLGRQSFQLYAPAAHNPFGSSLVFISVRHPYKTTGKVMACNWTRAQGKERPGNQLHEQWNGLVFCYRHCHCKNMTARILMMIPFIVHDSNHAGHSQ